MIRSPAGFGGEDRIKRYLDYYQPSYGVMMLSAGQAFSPASLFAAGEQGVWYDPSDFSTMFQDSAGTTPVTAVEQPVGRILDKSGRGNTATQATSASRPVLSARVNQLRYSEQFDNAAWSSPAGVVNVTETTVTAPNGTLTADKLVPNAATNYMIKRQNVTTTAASSTFSVYGKHSDSGYYLELFAVNALSVGAVFDLSTGAVLGSANCTTTVSSADANGWRRYSITFTPSVLTTYVDVRITTATTINQPMTANGTSGIFVWGADLRVTNDGVGIPAYQRIAAATDYDTTGFPYYLKFDGTDDSLATASINFSATDKMSVFAGARKLSDADQGMIAELSISSTANNGTFFLLGPSGALTGSYGFRSKGTVAANASVGSGYSAPVTNVLSGIGDIAGDIAFLRINGAEVARVLTDQGTGNFGNYPMYIGRRASTSLPFNGRLYSLIVRGAQSTATEISNTETWVNGKTMAY